MYKGNPLNYQFDKCAATMKYYIDVKGHTVWQKFTCAKCGSRQTMEEPNACHVAGRCEECNHRTDLIETGFGLLVRTNGSSL